MPGTRKVAVVVPWHGYGARVLAGISRFARQHPQWVLHLVQSDSPVLYDDLKEWQPDGIISSLLDTADPVEIPHYRRPWVCILARPDDRRRPFVTIDEDAVGRMAAEYFAERGLRSFAFIGNREHEFSIQRAEAFEHALNEQGYACDTFLYRTRFYSQTRRERVNIDRRKRKWLEQMEKPAAVFACNDWEAFQFIQFCRQQEYRVPEEFAVLGAGNDEMLCHVCNPPMSSVRIPFERVGYEAAELLDQRLDQRKQEQRGHELPPMGLVSRQSTDVFRVGDAVVAKALDFIREHLTEPIKVEDLLRHVFVSRTLLERKFKTELGRTPLVEIRRQRIVRARQLLADTDESILEIAEKCGFSSDIRLSTVFKEITGQSPSQYRRRVRVT
ncbi:xylose operon transcription regulator XylR [Kiritimatiella glycovorans]|uniref:AraC family transcriptional regulator n=1 Tax=Kiritimatiella glycovorans TaxID=1307763 RepID=A0A0G3EEF5_9BACT|nr:DNA-binding transcriptional regulator [Kiritimatiella glycovorans]AKJ64723.1 AraC family transcriptional regulator [Kiritimatiella glycovorans]